MQNYFGLQGENVCLDMVKVQWPSGSKSFCDESHQNKREFTFSDNKEYDPYLEGWFEWVEIVGPFNISFSSTEFGGSGSSNFAGFNFEWECRDRIHNECETHNHECSEYETCVDSLDGYSCHIGQADDPQLDQSQINAKNPNAIKLRGLNMEENEGLKERVLNLEKLGVADECTTCHPDAKCVENNCICKVGFMGSGQFCVPLGGKCRPLTAALCSPFALCHDLLGDRHICTCIEGYQGDGVTCSPINPCMHCHPNADCIEDHCVCVDGWSGDGTICRPDGGPIQSNKIQIVQSNARPEKQPQTKEIFYDDTEGSPVTEQYETSTFYTTSVGDSVFCKLEAPKGTCKDVLRASYEYILCLDSDHFSKRKDVEKLKLKLARLSADLCDGSQKGVGKQVRKCVDVTTPNEIFYNKFLLSKTFDLWTRAYRTMASKKYRYCRRKGPFKKKLHKTEKFYLKLVKK